MKIAILAVLIAIATATPKSPLKAATKPHINANKAKVLEVRGGGGGGGKIVFKDFPTPGSSSYYVKELLAGLVVAVATIPSSMSYAAVIGVNPVLGIWNTALVGLLTAIVGGQNGVITGSAAVTAPPLKKVVATLGTPYMTIALIWASILEVLFGLLKLSYLEQLVTAPVITGFLNALGAFIFKSQLKVFKGYDGHFLSGNYLNAVVSIATLSASIILGFAHFKISLFKIPPQLFGIAISALVGIALKLPLKTVADSAGKGAFVGGFAALPKFVGIPKVQLDFNLARGLFTTALSMAMICIIETLLAQRISHDSYRGALPDYEKDEPNQAVIGLGAGTLVGTLFGGIGACGLIPNTLLNGVCGGTGKVSVYAFAIATILAVVFFSPVLGAIPLASLAGLMFTVGLRTLELDSTKAISKAALHSARGFIDFLAMIVTFILCFEVDMGLGIVAGVVIAKIGEYVGKKTGSPAPSHH